MFVSSFKVKNGGYVTLLAEAFHDKCKEQVSNQEENIPNEWEFEHEIDHLE